MGNKSPMWERMDTAHIRLEKLVEEYLMVCRTEGKTLKTLHGYREKLSRFCRWLDGWLEDFTLSNARAYIAELQQVQKYEGHPFTPTQNKGLASQTVKGHAVVLKGFATWLWEEEYTPTNVLERMKPPKAARKLIEILSVGEVSQLLKAIKLYTITGCRNLAILLLFLDTGIRCAELVGLTMENLFLEDRCIKVMGKGMKERIVPFGDRTARALMRYLNVRPPAKGHTRVFLNSDGGPLTENAIKMVFERLAQKAGIPRLHVHLLRHTMATNYLLSGGSIIKLQRILGHETMDMTRRYVDMVAVQEAITDTKTSPVDGMQLKYLGGSKLI